MAKSLWKRKKSPDDKTNYRAKPEIRLKISKKISFDILSLYSRQRSRKSVIIAYHVYRKLDVILDSLFIYLKNYFNLSRGELASNKIHVYEYYFLNINGI